LFSYLSQLAYLKSMLLVQPRRSVLTELVPAASYLREMEP